MTANMHTRPHARIQSQVIEADFCFYDDGAERNTFKLLAQQQSFL